MKKLILTENLETLGKQYEIDHLSIWKKNKLETDSWEALKFFFYHSFMRGRRDELSLQYYNFTVKILYKFFNEIDFKKELLNAHNNNLYKTDDIIKLKKSKRNSIKHEDFDIEVRQKNPLIKILTTKIKITEDNQRSKNICLQNDTDLLMVLDTLNFISQSSDKHNIYKYFHNLVNTGHIKNAYNELITLSGVGDKLSTFFLRDIAIINRSNITAKQIEFVFPVDTWVAQITTLIAEKKFSAEKPNDIKEYYINNFPNSNFPLIAAGLWYLGYNSLEYAIRFAKNYRI